ncbi:lipopolysaccharide kinase InaA family protein [Fontivita pretiosa]|uniref:lipopolysaccharide kinase InaA family protein n=1 Tax=Fontivita pretiosa TaxID=2989684 RepID=UPI003D163CDC
MMHIAADYQPIFRELGIDAETVFTHPLIKPWRRLGDRENCILRATLAHGQTIRWHVKRYAPPRIGASTPASLEANGHRELTTQRIPTAKLLAWGQLPDRRSFVIFEDLDGYQAADQLVQAGTAFEQLLIPTAELAARLHRAELHHRDLYLCHFFARPLPAGGFDVRLIDSARVRRLPTLFTRTRWIVKDLAQFWYSTLPLPISDQQRDRWLAHYARECGLPSVEPLKRKVVRKAAWIARHDALLRRRQPHRNISIPADASSARSSAPPTTAHL